jgi:hypothetical protein
MRPFFQRWWFGADVVSDNRSTELTGRPAAFDDGFVKES